MTAASPGRLAHSREQVWRAVTEPERLAVWFPRRSSATAGEERAASRA